jgi:hypothetical protein
LVVHWHTGTLALHTVHRVLCHTGSVVLVHVAGSVVVSCYHMVKLTRLQFIFESQFCWYYSLVCGHQGNPTKVLWIAVVTLHVWYGIPEHVYLYRYGTKHGSG